MKIDIDLMLKILILGTYGIPAKHGGSEICVQNLALYLSKLGHQIAVASTNIKVHNLPSNIRLIPLPRFNRTIIDFPLRNILGTLYALIHRYDVIHYFGTDSGLFIKLLSFFKKNVIVTLDAFPWERDSYPSFLKKLLFATSSLPFKYSKISVCDSNEIISKYNMLFPFTQNKIEYIPYGSDVDFIENLDVLKSFNLVPNDYYLFVGRFVEEKGIDLIIKTFKRFSTKRKLVIVGNASNENKDYELKLRKSAQEDNRIIFTGKIYGNGYLTLMNNCYSYINASYVEGTSPVLIQAKMLRKKIIASNIPQNKETLSDYGVFFESGNITDFLSVLTAVENGDVIINNSKVASPDELDWERMTQKYLKLYFKLVGRNTIDQ